MTKTRLYLVCMYITYFLSEGTVFPFLHNYGIMKVWESNIVKTEQVLEGDLLLLLLQTHTAVITAQLVMQQSRRSPTAPAPHGSHFLYLSNRDSENNHAVIQRFD